MSVRVDLVLRTASANLNASNSSGSFVCDTSSKAHICYVQKLFLISTTV